MSSRVSSRKRFNPLSGKWFRKELASVLYTVVACYDVSIPSRGSGLGKERQPGVVIQPVTLFQSPLGEVV